MTAVGATIARGKIFQSCQRSGTRIADDACLAIPLHAGIGITFTQALYEAKKDGWTVISMKSGMTMQGKVIPLWLERADSSEETLTASEFDLLEVFAKHPNRPLQRDWLLEVTAHREMDAFDRANRPAHHLPAPQDRARPGAPRGHLHRARRWLHVRAADGVTLGHFPHRLTQSRSSLPGLTRQ